MGNTKLLGVVSLLLIVLVTTTGFASVDYPRRWFVEIEDACGDEVSKLLISEVKQSLDGKKYVITEHGEIAQSDQDKDSSISPARRFFILNGAIPKNQPLSQNDGKVYMRFNPKNAAGQYSADFLLFVYRGGSWERTMNPGNFIFNTDLIGSKLQMRIRDLIVTLPFK